MQPLLDLKSAAAVLGISPCTLGRAVRAGRIAHRRIGGAIRFTEDDIAEYVERCAVGVRGVSEPKVKMGNLKWVVMK